MAAPMEVDLRFDEAYIRLSEISQVCSSFKPTEPAAYESSWHKSNKNGRRKSYQAILQENVNDYFTILQQILQNGGDVNHQIPSDCIVRLHKPEILGYTALHFAVENVNVPALNTLLELGGDFSVTNHYGVTPLRLALNKSYLKGANMLQFRGTIVNPVIDLLLDAHVEAGHPINPRCNDGVSHFHIACMANNAKAVELFLENGVPTDETVSLTAEFLAGYTPLHFAARYCSLETIGLLLEHGADEGVVDARGMTPLHLLLEYAIEINDLLGIDKAQDFKWFRSDLAKIESAIKLLTRKANDDLNHVFDDKGLTYFHVACASKAKIASSDLAKVDNIHAAIGLDSPFCPGYTGLHFAACFSIKNFVLLMEHGADIYATDAKGVTPLDICLERYELSDILPIFSKNKVLNGIRMSNGTSLVEILRIMSDRTSLKSFLKNQSKADLNSCVSPGSPLWPGYNILHLAVKLAKTSRRIDIFDKVDHTKQMNTLEFTNKVDVNGSLDRTVALCLSTGVDITSQDVNAATPLHLAFVEQKPAVVSAILNEHRNVISNPTNSHDLSHFHITVCKGNDFVLNFLRSGTDVNSRTRASFNWFKNSSTIVRIAAGSTALHMAVSMENLRMMNQLLSYSADLSIKNDEGSTPIHVAFRENSRKIARILLSQPEALHENPASDEGISYFHIACYLKIIPAVEALLKLGVDVNGPISLKTPGEKDVLESGYTPLHFAIRNLSFDTVKLLVENGANMHAKSESGFTPFYSALKIYLFGNKYEHAGSDKLKQIVHYFYEALKRDSLDYHDEIGLTMLHLACICLDEPTIEQLLRSGADANAQIDHDSIVFPGFTALHFLTKFGYDDENQWSDGTRIAQLLLQYGADVNLRNAKGDTPIHTSYSCPSKNTKSACAELLRICEDLDVTSCNREGVSHFHMACYLSSAEVVKRALKSGVDVNLRTDWFRNYNSGFTPLLVAIDRTDDESLKVLQVLLKSGADVNAKDARGMTPLHLALHHHTDWQVKKVQILLGCRETEVNARNVYGKTPLDLFIRNNCCMVNEGREMQMLLTSGALLNVFNSFDSEGVFAKVLETGFKLKPYFRMVFDHATDLTNLDAKTGRDTLHNAVSIRGTKHLEDSYSNAFVKLLRNGCRLDRQDYQGKTPLHLAVEFQNWSAVNALIKLGSDVDVRDNQGNIPIYYCVNTPRYHHKTAEEFAWHVRRLMLAGISVSDANRYFCNRILSRIGPVGYAKLDVPYMKELQSMKQFAMYGDSYSVRDFMTQAAVSDYPTMPRAQRDAIRKFHRDQMHWIRENFKGLSYVFSLQFKNAMERTTLMESAKSALGLLAGMELPEPCSENIIRCVSNFDLKSLISLDADQQTDRKRRRVEEL